MSAASITRSCTMQDLNAAVDHDENGWPRLQIATGINDRGQIVGNAYFGDRPGLRPFLITKKTIAVLLRGASGSSCPCGPGRVVA